MLYNCKCTSVHSKSLHIFLPKTKVNACSSCLQNPPGKKMQNAATVLCMFLNMSFSGPLPQLMCAKWDTILQKVQTRNQDYFSCTSVVFLRAPLKCNEVFLSTALIHTK